MRRAIIFDIDGTLANNAERQKILLKNKYNWNDFFDAMGDDTPNIKIVEIFQVLKKSTNYKMLIVTARPERYKKLTEQWLLWNDIEFDKLYMRKDKDYRSDMDVKRDILFAIQKDYSVSFVFDDRSSVVKMWRDEGLTCFQCFDHDF